MLTMLLQRLAPLRPDVTIWVATSTHPRDDAVVALARESGAQVWRGSEHDVLSRFVDCAAAAHADIVIRLTADNPCVDAGLVREALDCWCAMPRPGYVSTHLGGYPHGLSVEVVSAQALALAASVSDNPADREHVTKWVRERPDRWPQSSPIATPYPEGIAVTVDTAEDLSRLRALDVGVGGALHALPARRILELVAASLPEGRSTSV